jgi:sugar phosphate isomerase/epimerase
MADRAKKADTVLVMEGGHNTVGQMGRVSRQLFEAVDSTHLRCAFDGAAFVGAGEQPFADCLPLLMPYIEYMHIKDAKFNSPRRVLPGKGDVELEKILDAVRNKDLVLSLEPHLAYAGSNRGFSGEEPFRQAHKALMDILNRLGIPFV